MVRMRSPVRIWPAAPKSAWSHVGLGAFSSYRIAFRTGDLTGEACLNKTRRPPKAVTASSNLASSSTSEQSPLCSGVFLCLWQKSHRPLRSLAPSSKPEPACPQGARRIRKAAEPPTAAQALGFGFVFLEKRKGGRTLLQVVGEYFEPVSLQAKPVSIKTGGPGFKFLWGQNLNSEIPRCRPRPRPALHSSVPCRHRCCTRPERRCREQAPPCCSRCR